MKNRFFLPVLFFVIVSTMLTVVLYMQQDTREKPVYVASISDVLTTGANDEGFSKADIKREFVFPEDAGPHPGFRSEWWYYTGNLKSENGRLFGYQLTIFRQALSASAPISASTWRTNQIYMAHFAVTDIHSNRFYSYSRTVRGASELAGAQSNPYRVWLEDWTITGFFNSPTLRAREKDISIHLNLKSLKDIVPQGDQGLSQKSAGKGNASYYFSQTRLKTTGKIKIKNETFQITGLSWLDREWSTSSLGKSDTGWDWFSLQLDDNRELMLYVIRQKNGKISPFSSGTLVNPDGTIKHLTQQLYRVTPLEFWKSPETGIQYPIRWSIEIPTIDLRLEVKPYIKNQEHKHNFVYWEGA
ncbi:carotenoid 1,2-hydratase, partial [bacterium]|nr:carotenoid 1,2-hydratase [bacterium]